METQKAAAVVRAGEGETVRWGPAGQIRVIAASGTTDSSFCIVEATEPPGSAAPLHVHHGEAEAFFVLEGAVELTCGDDTVDASAGDFVYTPRDVPHKYVVVGSEPARVLLLFSRPGFEQFFLDAGAPLDGPPGGPPDPRILEQYDLEVLEQPAH
jgi:mannose-6-phosphate isomerase-like protein (cupin superfamily)